MNQVTLFINLFDKWNNAVESGNDVDGMILFNEMLQVRQKIGLVPECQHVWTAVTPHRKTSEAECIKCGYRPTEDCQ